VVCIKRVGTYENNRGVASRNLLACLRLYRIDDCGKFYIITVDLHLSKIKNLSQVYISC